MGVPPLDATEPGTVHLNLVFEKPAKMHDL
jgi:hypothetical protein